MRRLLIVSLLCCAAGSQIRIPGPGGKSGTPPIAILDAANANSTGGAIGVWANPVIGATTTTALTTSGNNYTPANGAGQSVDPNPPPACPALNSSNLIYSRSATTSHVTALITTFSGCVFTGTLAAGVLHNDWNFEPYSNNTGASLVLVPVGQVNQSVVSGLTVSDTSSNSYSAVTTIGTSGNCTAGAGTPNSGVYFAVGPSIGSSSFYAQAVNSVGGFPQIFWISLSGTPTSSPIRAGNCAASIGATSLGTGSLTSLLSTDVVFTWGYATDNNSCFTSPPTGYTTLGREAQGTNISRSLAFAYKTSPSATENPTWGGCSASSHISVGAVAVKQFGT